MIETCDNLFRLFFFDEYFWSISNEINVFDCDVTTDKNLQITMRKQLK